MISSDLYLQSYALGNVKIRAFCIHGGIHGEGGLHPHQPVFFAARSGHSTFHFGVGRAQVELIMSDLSTVFTRAHQGAISPRSTAPLISIRHLRVF